MRNTFKLALVPLALASALASNSALAGSEACLEIYDGTAGDNATTEFGAGIEVNGVQAFNVLFTPSNCSVPRTGAGVNTLEGFDELNVAQELTKSFNLSLYDLDANPDLEVASAAADGLNIVYVPTSPIPGGTRITLRLHNANYVESQLYLVAANDVDPVSGDRRLDNADSNTIIAAATTDSVPTDGDVAGTRDFDFLVPSGLTIPAGTRMALSVEPNQVIPFSVQFANDSCDISGVDAEVGISVPNAINNIGGGTDIEGGLAARETIIDYSNKQFALFTGYSGPATGTVDALEPSLRTQFVAELKNGSLDVTETRVFLQTGFLNQLNSGSIDVGVALDVNDQVELWPASAPLVSDNVQIALFDEFSENGAAADTWADPILFDLNANDDPFVVSYTDALVGLPATVGDAQYGLDAIELFTAGADYSASIGNPVFWALTQTDTDEIITPSQFDVSFGYRLDFADDDLLDHCPTVNQAFDIGTNGSVIKVPYISAATNRSNIRVVNEFNQAAVVTMDIQAEVGTTAEPASFVQNVVLDRMVPPNGAEVYDIRYLLDAAVAAGFVTGGTAADGSSMRYTITLSVAAPNDSVHGTATNIINGSRDIMPVLDLNSWQQ